MNLKEIFLIAFFHEQLQSKFKLLIWKWNISKIAINILFELEKLNIHTELLILTILGVGGVTKNYLYFKEVKNTFLPASSNEILMKCDNINYF